MQSWFYKTFRILRWGPRYNQKKFWGDVKAGLTTGSMLIAQGMAYAVIMGMPPIYGLYAGFFPLLIYPLLGTSRNLSVGPVTVDMLIVNAGVSLLAATNTAEYITLVILLTMMTGLLELLLGTLRLGAVLKVFSRPVIAGFITAAPIIIGFTQLDHLLGLHLPDSQYITVIIASAWHHIGAVDGPTMAWSAAAIAILAFLKYARPRWPGAVIVLSCGIFIAWITNISQTEIQIVGSIPHGLPHFALPQANWHNARRLLPTAFTLALVEFMSVASLSKAFAKRHNYRVDTNHELIAIGASNLFGSLFSTLPVSGSFSRSAAADQAGGKTALANWFTALVILITLLFLTGVFFYLPMPVLAAIIIVAVAGLINFREIFRIYNIDTVDGAIAVFTFVCTLFIGIQAGILLGIGASVLALIYNTIRSQKMKFALSPRTSLIKIMEKSEADISENMHVLRIETALTFFNADFFQDEVLSILDAQPNASQTIILDARHVTTIDTTAIESLKSTTNTIRKYNGTVYLAALNDEVAAMLARSGIHTWLERDQCTQTVEQAVTHQRQQSSSPETSISPPKIN